jgi:hypothetical protein
MTRELRSACKDYEQELVLYYYGESMPSEHERTETHLKSCVACQGFLADVRLLLPLTVETDEPPETFWQSYSREFGRKLDIGKPQSLWQRIFSSVLGPWRIPALATALTLLLAVGVTLTRNRTQTLESPPAQEAVLEVLPLAENLEFFTAMDILDSLELIEEATPLNGGA